MKTVALFFCLLAGAAAQTVSALIAGVARVDVTPTVSMPMYGYENRKCGPSAGMHDPLFAKVLVLENGGGRVAIVTLDLGSIVSERLKDEVRTKLNIPVLLLAASHTHSGPAFLPYGSAPVRDGSAAAYQAELERKIFNAVEQASRSMFPAKLAVGRGSIQLGYNRLIPQSDGRARVAYRNPERIPYGPVDPEFMLLRVEDGAGRTRALLVHYAVHAVVLGQSNCKFSADYPGVMQSAAEHELPGAQVMFVQGGAGDTNPLFLGRSEDEATDFGTTQKMGEMLAAEVLKANGNAAAVEAGPIRARSQLLEFRNRWDKDKKLAVGVTTILIGKNIAIATVPGEPMHRLQKMWKSQAEVAYPLFFGYTYSNGGTWAGYIPDLGSAARGGYGADVSTSIEVGAGERIIQQHLINLYDMQGMWRDTPGKP
jgi:neutral ceramidase